MAYRRLFIKKSGLILMLGSVLLFSFSGSTEREEQEPQNIVVTLNVDTGQIQKSNASAYCNFGQPEGVSNEDFTIIVNIGDVVTWQGVSSSSDKDVVNITAINHEGGKNVFGQNVLKGDGANPEKVVGKVLYPTPDNQDYKYKISFTVTNNGSKRNGTFHIDPKIQAH